MGKLYTTETLSEYLQVSPRTIRRERNDGRLSFVVVRGQIRYREEDIERYLSLNEWIENHQGAQVKAV
jgi:excisionase family DNA binding protein